MKALADLVSPEAFLLGLKMAVLLLCLYKGVLGLCNLCPSLLFLLGHQADGVGALPGDHVLT